MKQATIFLMLLIYTSVMIGQTKTDYLEKSKKQKKAAWILLGAGTASVIAGFAIGSGDDPYGLFDQNNDSPSGSPFIGLGGLSMLGSIPLFIASGRNKRKAMSLSFKNEKIPYLLKNNISLQVQPPLKLKIEL